MTTERKVQCLTHLDLKVSESRLMLIEAKGISDFDQPGVPKLVPVFEIGAELNGGLLELDFINQPVEQAKRKKITFEIRIVIDLNKLSGGLKGIKVNAEENADIVLIK
ncbi:MAG TPA: hypothetical protein ENH02_06750 [Bacteroidetes bacterium]|nr:hypothetical protein [Bacteroidota bacterium]